ncbi:hypothetical protein [Mycolicibacterium goodii]|uniref:hypothetical protein n=1 Tax=Mycolicibacterium goodii TaxID=134601 RepID=UPI001BDD04CD|nr:hypothetical protein [Mycolicibacterium goodii]MBU8830868.1 hypothetical protein [Mycolicibacterium goodii]
MAVSKVYECDWCHANVPVNAATKQPAFAARITVQTLQFTTQPQRPDEICADCLQVYRAIQQGRFRR